MPEANPAERVVDRRATGDDAEAALQLRLELSERDVRARLDQSAQVALMRLQEPAPIAAKARRRRASGRAHPLHQLDRRRWTDGKSPRGCADRATALDCANDPFAKILGHWCRHHTISMVSTITLESQAPIPRNRNML